MARVNHVKKAAKDYPDLGIKKGQEYWWVKPYRCSKRIFTKPPLPSQTTNSEFYATLWGIQEDMAVAHAESFEELQSMRDNWVSDLQELADDCRSKFDNMPEGLQQGDTGQLLEQRADAIESYISDLESVDLDTPECDDDLETEPDFSEEIAQKLQELQDCSCDE